jgi:hypothetical protein
MNCDYCNVILDSETFILECGHIVHRGCGYILFQNGKCTKCLFIKNLSLKLDCLAL